MATQKRAFEAEQPVMTTSRWADNRELNGHDEVKRYAFDLVRDCADRANVRVLAVAVLGTHYHLAVMQDFDGIEDPNVKPGHTQNGITAFHRGLNSRSSRQLGYTLTTDGVISQGRKYEAPYHSHRLQTAGDLLGYMTYVLCQARRHHLREDQVWTSRGVFDGERTVVNCLPDFTELPGDTVSERRVVLGQLLDEIADDFIAREQRSDIAAVEEAEQNQHRRRPFMPSTLRRRREDERRANLTDAVDHVAEGRIALQKPTTELIYVDVECISVPTFVRPPDLEVEYHTAVIDGRVRVTHAILRHRVTGVEYVVSFGLRQDRQQQQRQQGARAPRA